MLSCLVREGFAQRHPNDVRYYAGPMMFEIGLALPQYQLLRECVEPQLERLCKELDCIASFSLRSRHELVCAFQKRGPSELPGMLIRVGTRRPLIAAVGGLAILQRLRPVEAALILEDNLQTEITRRGTRRLPDLARMRQRSQRAGYGYTRGDLAPGIWAMAEAVLDESGHPFAALTVAGHESGLAESEAGPIHEELVLAVRDITARAAHALRRPGADEGTVRSA
ncbi:hypothetical protein ASF43_05480 [Pseudorhodoferax sp. Leaf267]|nr:hypothetical protein ASF43_05480 [Pseudorhodoferax sp. Leaf267]